MAGDKTDKKEKKRKAQEVEDVEMADAQEKVYSCSRYRLSKLICLHKSPKKVKKEEGQYTSLSFTQVNMQLTSDFRSCTILDA